MNSIFVLKPVLDLIYEDAKKDKEETESLKKRIKELEEELDRKYQLENATEAVLNIVPKIVQKNESVEIDDSLYIVEASLPASSNPIPVKNEIVQEGETKTIKMINNMTKKEYMKEYQKNYRKKQKKSKENSMNV